MKFQKFSGAISPYPHTAEGLRLPSPDPTSLAAPALRAYCASLGPSAPPSSPTKNPGSIPRRTHPLKILATPMTAYVMLVMWGSGFYRPNSRAHSRPKCQTVPCLTVVLWKYHRYFRNKLQSPVTRDDVIGVHEYFRFIKISETVGEDCKNCIEKYTYWFLFALFSLYTSSARPV